MKKKLLSLALVFVMALTLLPTAALATDGNDDGTNPPVVECTEHVYVDGVCTNCGAKQDPAPPADDVPRDTTGSDLQENPTPPADEDSPDRNDVKEGNNVGDSSGNQQDGNTATGTTKHELLQEVQAKAATCTTTGNIHYYICKCGKYFSDEACTNEIEKSSVTIAALEHDYVNDYCTRCKAQEPGGTHTHTYTLVNAEDATCTKPGHTVYYSCVCGKYFSFDGSNYSEISASETVVAAKGHTRPDSGVTALSSIYHIYTCAVCGEKEVKERHTPDAAGTCTICGFEGSSSSNPNPPSHSGVVDISSVQLNSYSISVTWYSDEPDGTGFDIYVDSDRYATDVRPSRSSGGYFSYTMDFSHYLGDSYYTVSVYLHGNHNYYDSWRVNNRYYDHDYDYWYDHRYPNGTPGTNSYGIPHASQVNGRYSASEAIRILRNKNQNSLQNDLMSNSSALDSYERLERAVKDANHVSVNVSTDRGVPSAIRAGGGVQITGAAFNASSTNSTVRLVVGTPSVSRYVGRGYQFSMSLTGVGNDSSLDVPVVVSMPLPSDISASYVKVLHYHNSNVPTVITPKVSGSRISFPLTGFSDFVVTDSGVPNYTYVSDGYGGYYVPVGNVPRQSLLEQHVAIVAPILASMPPSGYVFDDVAPGHWAAAAIRWARDGGMMSGYYDGTFRPYAATTRQELWMVLARLAGARPADMEAARIWAVNAGISDGRNPYSPLSRQQMISMLYRYAQYLGRDISGQVPLRNYRDNAAVSGYARNAMAWALDQGILTSDADGFLFPQNIATRADFAVYLYRFVN